MKIKRKELIDTLRIIRPGIDDNSTNISGMDCFIFMDGRVHSHDDAVSLSAPTEIEGNFAVSADEFYNIIYRFSKDEIDLEIQEDGLHLKCGKAKATVMFRKDDVSKRIKQIAPSDTSWKKLPTDFCEAMKLLHIRNTPADISARIGGVFILNCDAYASDNVSVVKYTFTSSMERMWISPRSLGILNKVGHLDEYCMVNSWIHFRSKELMVSCRKQIDEKYPYLSFDDIISNSVKEEISGVMGKELIDIINRAAVFGKEKGGDFVLNLTFDKNCITISSNSSTGSFEESLECPLFCNNPGTVTIGAVRLKQAISRWAEGVEFNAAFHEDNPLLVFKHSGFTEALCLYKE